MKRLRLVSTSRVRNFLDFRRDPLSFMVRMLDEGDIVSLRTGARPSFIVNAPDLVQEILVTKEASFRKGRTSAVLRRTIGDGLLTSERAVHERQKRALQPLFYKERLQQYADTVVRETQKLADRLRDGQTLQLHEELMQLTLTIITETMFATSAEGVKQELAAAVTDTIEQSARSLFSPILLPMGVPTRGHRIHSRAIRTLESMIHRVISEARREPERFRFTLLGLLMDTVYENGEPVSEREIRDQMMTMLLAGHETSANLLSWIFYALSQNPEVEARLREEALATDPLQGDAYSLMKGYPYMQMVIQEALRLYPPAWLIYREADREVELDGDRYRADSTFMICPYALHRNPAVFDRPEAFLPERFADDGASRWPRFAYFPFGGGSRACIGSRFALMETTLILAVLARQAAFRPLHEGRVEPEPLVSLRIKGGLTVKVERRT